MRLSQKEWCTKVGDKVKVYWTYDPTEEKKGYCEWFYGVVKSLGKRKEKKFKRENGKTIWFEVEMDYALVTPLDSVDRIDRYLERNEVKLTKKPIIKSRKIFIEEKD